MGNVQRQREHTQGREILKGGHLPQVRDQIVLDKVWLQPTG